MSELEVPTDHLHETLHEKAHEEGGGFSLRVALASALIAVLAAVCALFAGADGDDAMMAQIKSSDQWSFYEAKSIKATVLEGRAETLKALGRRIPAQDAAKVAQDRKDMAAIKVLAESYAQQSEELTAKGGLLSKGVTLFQIAIALSAISVLTKRRFLWGLGLLLSGGGTVFLVLGLR